MSPSGMGRRLSALAFWFMVRGEADVIKCFFIRGFWKSTWTRDIRHLVSGVVIIGGCIGCSLLERV